MAEFDYDLFVIGAGSGGVRAARMAAARGAKVAIAEEYRTGGTCVVRGCVPKKFFVYASEFGHGFKDAEGYGWKADQVSFDWQTLLNNKDAEIDRLSGIYYRNLHNSGVEIFLQRAEITDKNTIQLKQSPDGDARTVTAKFILIATGSTPFVPNDIQGAEHGITSNEVFHIENLPKHAMVLGGGYIACEFACIFAGLGVDTCLVYRGDTVLRGFDDDVRTHVHEEMNRQGVRVITHAVVEKIEKPDAASEALNVTLSNGMHIESDLVMYAMGRTPNTKGLGCEAVGVKLAKNGAVEVDKFSQSSVDTIYAVGDVTDRVNLTPVAIREGAAFAATVFGDQPTAFDHTDIPMAVFTQPPAGVVGLSEADARRQFGQVDIYKSVFRPMKNTLNGKAERMLIKLVVKTDDQRVVGAHMVGPDSPEMIQVLGIAVKAGLTKAQFDETCALHPTLAEEIVTLNKKFVPVGQEAIG